MRCQNYFCIKQDRELLIHLVPDCLSFPCSSFVAATCCFRACLQPWREGFALFLCFCCSIELRSILEGWADNVPVVCLHEDIGHPMVIISQRVTDCLDAQILAQETSSPGASTEHGPLHCLKLSTTKMTSHAGSGEKHSCSSRASQSDRKSECAPTTLCFEELILVE